MSPKDYCLWCSTSHADQTCMEYQQERRESHINHSCHICRRWAEAA